MEEEIKPSELSKYNEAALQIQRLHNLSNEIKQCANSGDFWGWFFRLDRYWEELYADAKKRTDDPAGTLKQHKYLRLKALIAANENRTEWYNSLIKRTEFMKELQDKVGKGGIYEDESEKGFE